jgi:hypothetical protein
MVTPMSDELDPKLLALFAEAHEPLHDASFVAAFLKRMERARRVRTAGRIAMTVIAVFTAVWLMPSVLDQTASIAQAIGDRSSSYGPLIISPWGWGISMFIGLAVLLRTGALRRR